MQGEKEGKSTKAVGVYPSVKSASRFKFKLSQHGIKWKYKRKYSYKCQVKGCMRRFDNVKDWNKHHRSRHTDVTYTCKKCGRISDTPIQHRDHTYLHKEIQFSCGCCCKSFPSISRLSLHCHVHKRQCLYSCFASHCKKEYKWLQDLLHHLKVHLPNRYKCSKCKYSNLEKRLLVQHSRVHTDELPHACRQCGK